MPSNASEITSSSSSPPPLSQSIHFQKLLFSSALKDYIAAKMLQHEKKTRGIFSFAADTSSTPNLPRTGNLTSNSHDECEKENIGTVLLPNASPLYLFPGGSTKQKSSARTVLSSLSPKHRASRSQPVGRVFSLPNCPHAGTYIVPRNRTFSPSREDMIVGTRYENPHQDIYISYLGANMYQCIKHDPRTGLEVGQMLSCHDDIVNFFPTLKGKRHPMMRSQWFEEMRRYTMNSTHGERLELSDWKEEKSPKSLKRGGQPSGKVESMNVSQAQPLDVTAPKPCTVIPETNSPKSASHIPSVQCPSSNSSECVKPPTKTQSCPPKTESPPTNSNKTQKTLATKKRSRKQAKLDKGMSPEAHGRSNKKAKIARGEKKEVIPTNSTSKPQPTAPVADPPSHSQSKPSDASLPPDVPKKTTRKKRKKSKKGRKSKKSKRNKQPRLSYSSNIGLDKFDAALIFEEDPLEEESFMWTPSEHDE